MKNGATHLRDNSDSDFIIRLVHCSSEDVSLNSICLNVLDAAFGIFLNGKSCPMIGACIFMAANETGDLMWMGSPIQNNC